MKYLELNPIDFEKCMLVLAEGQADITWEPSKKNGALSESWENQTKKVFSALVLVSQGQECYKVT